MIKTILDFFFPEPTEIRKVEKALKRYRERLFYLQVKYALSIKTNYLVHYQIIKIISKIERVESWLDILKQREIKKNAKRTSASDK